MGGGGGKTRGGKKGSGVSNSSGGSAAASPPHLPSVHAVDPSVDNDDAAPWDQFAANEELFSVHASFPTAAYMTAIDASSTPQQIAEADALSAAIAAGGDDDEGEVFQQTQRRVVLPAVVEA